MVEFCNILIFVQSQNFTICNVGYYVIELMPIFRANRKMLGSISPYEQKQEEQVLNQKHSFITGLEAYLYDSNWLS